MSDDARFHRTFLVLPDRYVVYFDLRTDAFQKAGAIRAWTVSHGALRPTIIVPAKGQDFAKAATAWEIHNSLLVGQGGQADPVVDSHINNAEVVGHFGWFAGDQFFGPEKFKGNWTPPARTATELNDYLKDGLYVLATRERGALDSIKFLENLPTADALIASGAIPDVRSYRDFGPAGTAVLFKLLTDVNGRVLGAWDAKSVDALAESPLQLIDLILLPKLAYDLSALAIRGSIRTLGRMMAERGGGGIGAEAARIAAQKAAAERLAADTAAAAEKEAAEKAGQRAAAERPAAAKAAEKSAEKAAAEGAEAEEAAEEGDHGDSDSGRQRRGEKGKSFRGGSKKTRDNWYGKNDKDFQRWWHREGKAASGGGDIENAQEAQEVYEEWIRLGQPKPK